jgi:ABC-type multidrug transport system ATPase subunit
VESRGKRAMVLTTHSMEEADVLCSRIGIITDGVLRTVGPQVRLKSLYGGGYHLYVNCHKENYIRQKEYVFILKTIIDYRNFKRIKRCGILS